MLTDRLKSGALRVKRDLFVVDKLPASIVQKDASGATNESQSNCYSHSGTHDIIGDIGWWLKDRSIVEKVTNPQTDGMNPVVACPCVATCPFALFHWAPVDVRRLATCKGTRNVREARLPKGDTSHVPAYPGQTDLVHNLIPCSSWRRCCTRRFSTCMFAYIGTEGHKAIENIWVNKPRSSGSQ
jgi:hypothetical protein